MVNVPIRSRTITAGSNGLATSSGARAVMAAFDGGVLTRHGHLEQLARRGLSHGGLTDLAGLAEAADEELTRALITWVARSERFEGGGMAEALREGTLVVLLDRLFELYDL